MQSIDTQLLCSFEEQLSKEADKIRMIWETVHLIMKQLSDNEKNVYEIQKAELKDQLLVLKDEIELINSLEQILSEIILEYENCENDNVVLTRE